MTVGADLHALRKRRGLTLDELSAASAGTTWGSTNAGP